MRKLFALTAVVAVVVASADPASAAWGRNCGCRGRLFGRAWIGNNQGGQVYYTNAGGTYMNNAPVQQGPQTVTAGYPPNDAPAPVANPNSAPPPAPPTDIGAPAPQPNR